VFFLRTRLFIISYGDNSKFWGPKFSRCKVRKNLFYVHKLRRACTNFFTHFLCSHRVDGPNLEKKRRLALFECKMDGLAFRLCIRIFFGRGRNPFLGNYAVFFEINFFLSV